MTEKVGRIGKKKFASLPPSNNLSLESQDPLARCAKNM
jgi:hypothetical protein